MMKISKYNLRNACLMNLHKPIKKNIKIFSSPFRCILHFFYQNYIWANPSIFENKRYFYNFIYLNFNTLATLNKKRLKKLFF